MKTQSKSQHRVLKFLDYIAYSMSNTNDSKHAVVKKQWFKNPIKETEKIILNQMPDNRYRVELIPHDSDKILKLTDNTYKTFYWSGSDKHTYYKYDPRFFDSRYAVGFPATDYHLDIFRVLQGHMNSPYYIDLHPDYKNVLNCYSDLQSDVKTWCGGAQQWAGQWFFNKNIPVIAKIQEHEEIEKFVGFDKFVQKEVIYSHYFQDEYCRVPQQGANKDLYLPFNKPSESTFVKKMKTQLFDVSCITFGHRRSHGYKAYKVKEMVRKIEESIKPDGTSVQYAVDCDPQDESVEVMQDKELCMHSDSMTLFLAIPKHIDAVIPATTLMEFKVEGRRTPSYHAWYSDLPPWGNLKNVGLKHDDMLSVSSSMERLELDTTEMKSADHMFDGISATYKGNFKYWDTSKVTNMFGMFYEASWSKNSIDITNWDTSNVTDMSYMFSGAGSFNQDITSWDTSKVEKVSCMFTSYPNKEKHRELTNKFWDVKGKELKKKGFTKDKVICKE